MGHEILVSLTRGRREESHHHGAYCVVRDGRVERSRGDVEVPVYMRSAAKPLQALAVVESEAPDRFGFTEEELAMVVGSHSGSPAHAAHARSMLEKAGADPSLLRCGGHRPLGRDVYEDYVRRDYRWGRLEDNCSGKHAGMIAAAIAWEHDPATYAEPDHPVQAANLANVAALCGMAPRDIPTGTDGCAVPSFAIPVRAMATALATFTTPDELPYAKATAARRIMKAMHDYPEMVAGPRRFDTRLIRAGAGRLIAKEGAEGVEVVGMLEQNLGIAVKIADGATRAVHAVVAALLIDLGVLSRADAEGLYPSQVLSREGVPVGDVKVRL